MINLSSLFSRKGPVVQVSKEEVELLKFFMYNKADFENWFLQQKMLFPKIKFHFYYPNAVDFFFDEFKLFTVYYNKEVDGSLEYTQFKMSQTNLENIKTSNWKPFKDVMLSYLAMADQRNTDMLLKKQKSLQEYQVLCKEEVQSKSKSTTSYLTDMLATQ